MPKKRNTYWSRSKKEKQILTARLIEISIKVEDCIYKHKPISICEAEQYMKEVSSYKTLCSPDERSLQVIEKLTRCMKAIISDHQELGSVNHTIDSPIADVARAGSISPVYSIPDEDRTQLTQTAEAEPNITIANTDVEVIDLCNIDDDDLMYNGPDTASADHASSRITVEVDIHRAMSSLSLKDGEQLDMTSTDVNYTQSILKEFEDVGHVEQNEITCQEVVQDELVGSVTDKGKTNNVMDAGKKNIYNISTYDKTAGLAIKPDTKSKTNSATIEPIIAANSKNNVNFKTVVQKPLEIVNKSYNALTDDYQKDNTISSKTLNPATNNIPEIQYQTRYDSNRTCTINDSSHIFKDANYITQPMPNIVQNPVNLNVNAANTFNKVENREQPSNVIDTSKTVNNTAIVKENPTKNKRGPQKKKVIDETEIKPKNKRVYRAPKSKKENTLTKSVKNKSIPIYNENVINDLSWVENIRFVREIRVDENDPKLNLEDSFWDNYYLPANWSDNEFM